MKMIIAYLCFSTFLLASEVSGSYGHAARVLELSERFLDVHKDGIWLVKFYAPWCGHCKKLEPIFNLVAQSLHDSVIRVGRVDCTRFPAVATEFEIGGYPTIMLLKGTRRHIYRGTRELNDIVTYAKRMAGPAINYAGNEPLQNVLNRHDQVFVFVGERDGELWEAFNHNAVNYQPHCDFFSFVPSQVPPDFLKTYSNQLPLVFVHKEEQVFVFNPKLFEDQFGDANVTTALGSWISRERFPTFVKVTHSNFNHLLATKKFIVMAVLEENKLGKVTQEETEFKDMVESVMRTHRRKYHEYFQFGWVGSPELANTVAMTKLPIPSLLVVNSTSYHHHIPDDEPQHLTSASIVDFLEQILNDTVVAYGGNSFPIRAYRKFYDTKTWLVDMWIGNPILTTVLFGLPLGFLSLIFYSICCADIMDAPEEDEYGHEKRD